MDWIWFRNSIYLQQYTMAPPSCFPSSIMHHPCSRHYVLSQSPRHLTETDREEEALKVLTKLDINGSNEEFIQREFHEIKMTIAAEKIITVPGSRIVFTVPQWRTRLMHSVAVQVFAQFTGISE
jgi:hypothetical protein